MAVSPAGQTVSDCLQGYHVGGRTTRLVEPETELGGITELSNCLLTSGGLGPTG